MSVHRRIAISSAAVALFASQSSAIIHNDPGRGATPAEYAAFAARPEFQATGYVKVRWEPDTFNQGGFFFGSCTLIHRHWVLTAAHLFGTDLTFPDLPGITYDLLPERIGFGSNWSSDPGITATPTQYFDHPSWGAGNGGYLTPSTSHQIDLSLVYLDEPVVGITPAQIYTGSLAEGQPVNLVGYGRTGTASSGAVAGTSGTKRAGVSFVNRLDAYGSNGRYVGAEWENTHNVVYYGGGAAPGDSGGSAYVEVDGGMQLALTTTNGFQAPGWYGWYDTYGPRLANQMDWIRSTMQSLARPGDTDLSWSVDFADLLTLAQNYGTTSGMTWATGDFDNDGGVLFADLLALAQNYGWSTSAVVTGDVASIGSAGFQSDWAHARSLVPEPATALVLLAASMIAGRRARD